MKRNDRYTRATVYFSPDIHKSLRLRSAETGTSISQIVNEAIRRPPSVEIFPGYADRYRVRHGRFRIVYHVDDRRKEATIVSVGYRIR